MKQYTVGRNTEADIILTANLCSRNHAKLTVSDSSKIILQDFSSNGTTINGKKINNESVEIKRSDNILFAGVEKLDWAKIDIVEIVPEKSEVNASKIELTTPKTRIEKSYGKIIGAVAVAIVLLAGIFFLLKPKEPKVLTASEIYERYQNSVALVEVTYYVRAKTVANDLYFGMDENGEVVFDKDKSKIKPFSSQGTAFFIDSNGTLVTNHHVVRPWAFDETLSKYFNKIVKPRIKQALRTKDWDSDSVEFKGELDGMYIYTNGSRFTPSNRIACVRKATSENEAIDLATIQTASHSLPRNSTIVSLKNADTNEKHLQVGEAAYVVSFPLGDELAKNEDDELHCTTTSGNFTQAPAKNYIQYSAAIASGSSGSPVFNQYGQLVAITYQGTTKGQSFNRGILVKYVKGL